MDRYFFFAKYIDVTKLCWTNDPRNVCNGTNSCMAAAHKTFYLLRHNAQRIFPRCHPQRFREGEKVLEAKKRPSAKRESAGGVNAYMRVRRSHK